MTEYVTVMQINEGLISLGHQRTSWSIRDCAERLRLYDKEGRIHIGKIPVIRSDLEVARCNEDVTRAIESVVN